jgi:hypothetical protein
MMVHKYALPHSELLYTLTYRYHNTGRLMSRIDGGARLHIPFHDIAGTQAAGTQLHKQFARANLGDGQFDDAHIIVAMVLDC